jgi:hypothetical protein
MGNKVVEKYINLYEIFPSVDFTRVKECINRVYPIDTFLSVVNLHKYDDTP